MFSRRTHQAAQARRSARGAHAARRRRGFPGLRRLLALLLVLPAVALQLAASTPAGAVVVANFEIDGNTPDDAAVGGVDWGTPVGTRTTDPTQKDDESNFTASKEFQNPSAWQEKANVSTNQGDLTDVYSHVVSGAESWAFLGFRRLAESGTMTFMVEFNQKPNLPKEAGDSAHFRPDRSVNDLLLRFEQDGNGVFALTAAYKWTRSATGSFPAGCFPVPGYTPASAYCPTSVTGSGFVGATGENKLFAEAAVNLSSFDTVGDCRGAFGVMNVRSFAGNDESSSLLDFVGGVGIRVPPTCGQLVIRKKDQFQDPVGGATFKISPNPTPGVTGAAASSLLVKDGTNPGPGAVADGTADGTVTIDPAKPGLYTVEETEAPHGYIRDTTLRTGVRVGSGSSVATVDFVNSRIFEPLSVENVASGSYGVEYDWLVHKSVVGAATKTVEEGATATFEYQVELEALPAGPPSGKEVHGTMTVTNPNPVGSPAMRATLGIAGDLPCAFTPSNDAVDVDEATAGVQVDVAAAAALSYAYTCEPGPGPMAGGTITAKATWDQVTYPQVPAHPGFASDAATYAITVQPRIDELASVTDDFAQEGAVRIGADSYAWSDVWDAPMHRVVVATYASRPLSGVAGACTTYANVARVDESDSEDFDTADQTVELCVDLDDLEVSKTAVPSFSRDYDWTITKSVDAPSRTVPGGTPASFEYDVVVTPSEPDDSRFRVEGVITVLNPNKTPIAGVTLSDELPGARCTVAQPPGPLTIEPGKTEFDYACVLPDAGTTQDTAGTNTAKATWNAADYHGTDGSATGEASFDFGGAVVEVTDGTATVTDTQRDLDGADPDGVVLEAVDGVRTFTYTTAFEGEAGTCTPYGNTATVVADDSKVADSSQQEVEVCVGEDLTVRKTVGVAYDRLYDWSLAKSGPGTVFVGDDSTGTATYDITVKALQPTDSDVTVVGTITIDNPNDFQDVVADVTDTFTLGGVDTDCDVTGGPADDGQDVVVPRGGSLALGYTCHLTAGTWPESYQGSNEVTVTWDEEAFATPTGADSHQVTVLAPEVTETPAFRAIDLEDAITEAGGEPAKLAIPTDYQRLTWDEVHAEDGNQVTFSVTASLAPALEPGECTTYTNVVSIADSAFGPGSATTEVCRPAIAKDEEATYGVEYKWLIGKDADKTSVEVGPGGRPTFTYTVTVKPDGSTESTPTWRGTITVTNPSAITPLTADVSDVPDVDSWTCAVDGAATVEVAQGEQEEVGYTCTPGAGATREGIENTARAAFGDGERIEDTIPVTFDEVPTNDTITVTDPKAPDGGVLGAATWSAGETSFQYPWTAPESATGACTPYDNTATISETGQLATQQVTVCVEAPLTATVDASADLHRTYAWSVDKVADATQRTVDATGGATFRYTVTARAGSATDSGWRLSGTVIAANTNTYEEGAITLTGVSVATDLGGGSSCTAVLPESPVVPAASGGTPGTLPVPFDCTFTSAPGGTGTVTAGVTSVPAGKADPMTVLTPGTGVGFGIRSETDEVVDVVDDKTVPGQRIVLGEDVTWQPGLTMTYTYDLTLAGGAAGACAAYTNTASVDLAAGADPSASATVRACTPAPAVLPPTAPEVLPQQAFGKAVGSVTATCQGTVRARMGNRTGHRVGYVVRVGAKAHRVTVRSGANRTFVTQGPARARVVLRAQGKVLDRVRIPRRCAPPEVLPETGLRGVAARRASLALRWR